MYIVLLHYKVYFMVTSVRDEMMQTIDCVPPEKMACSERGDNWGALFKGKQSRLAFWHVPPTPSDLEALYHGKNCRDSFPFYRYNCQFI